MKFKFKKFLITYYYYYYPYSKLIKQKLLSFGCLLNAKAGCLGAALDAFLNNVGTDIGVVLDILSIPFLILTGESILLDTYLSEGKIISVSN